jgi:hypothetical protein
MIFDIYFINSFSESILLFFKIFLHSSLAYFTFSQVKSFKKEFEIE